MAFHFDAESHTYTDARGERIPNITQLLERAGLIDDTWYTEESCDRGQAVHLLTAQYDLAAIDGADAQAMISAYKGYLLGHMEVMALVRPRWANIEVPRAHPTFRLAGRPDRDGIVFQAQSVWEIKSGAPTKAHPIQTALQAILIAEEVQLPHFTIQRYCCYLEPSGRYKVEQHKNLGDFRTALDIIARHSR